MSDWVSTQLMPPGGKAQRGLMGQQTRICPEFPEGAMAEGHKIRFRVTEPLSSCSFECSPHLRSAKGLSGECVPS